ncbi:GNAT family N-acetyltransferase [Microbacterium fluvii]|uniref:GNAT family N-acetyltransferase n=1 Tax=Microbacterium fluvii TaxID=415215 RepID=A0ABW2HC46_9MICO|nr:GNAT family N-acetyltransferase [Microbacterium fluvii]MCU4671647.1 GNAT family N-acetyltransferase [Microbacterium fluvii]
MSSIRPFRPGDEPALAEICLRTADAGADATGVLADDDLWAEIFVLPYVARHPEWAWVVQGDDGEPAGYLVGAPDTDAFEEWFAEAWWPRFADRWPRPEAETTRQDGILLYAYGRRPGAEPFSTDHPAHLHIDLLPDLQGQGWGRRLIDTYVAALREAGVTGLHLVADANNAGVIGFYPRLGFAEIPAHEGVRAFGMAL